MTCAPFDLKDYFFGELEEEAKESVRRHAEACEACQDELAALQSMSSAVLCIREEEPPRRIAFISDKVFEPRWWQRIWNSTPQLGFASAAMIAAAIVFHGVQAPAQAPAPAVAQVKQGVSEAEVARRIRVEVAKAVAESEQRQVQQLLQAVSARMTQNERRHELELKTVAEYLDRMDKRNLAVRKAWFDGAIQ